MKLRQKILQISGDYQNIELKGIITQFLYFMIRYLFKIPILSAVGIVKCKLIQNFKFIFKTDKQYFNGLSKISYFVLISYLMYFILLATILIKRKRKNKQYWKFLFFIMVIFEALNSLGSYFLLQIFVQSDIFICRIISICFFSMAQIPMIIIDKVLISFEGTKNNLLSHKINSKILVSNILEKISFYLIVILTLLNENEQFFRNGFYGVLTIIYTVQIYFNVSQKYYINNLSHFLQTFGISICLILLVLINIYEISQESLLLNNIFQLSFVVGIFVFLSIYSYSKYMENQYLFMSLDQITSKQLLIPYLSALYKLWKYQNSKINSYFISSLRKNHSISCKNLHCECKKQIKLNQKDANCLFIQNYSKKHFQYLLNYKKDTNIILQILFLKLQIFHDIFSVNQRLNQIKTIYLNNKDISIEAGIYILTRKLEEMIQQQNSKNASSIQVISVLNLQQKINEIQKIVINDIHIKRHKWNYLCQNICKSLDIQEDIVKQILNIINFELIYHENKLNYKKNLAFNALSMFYYSSIIFLKKQIQMIERNINELITPLKYSFFNNQKQLQHNIFNHKCCLIQFDIHFKDQLTQQFQLIISNCNVNIINVFNCHKNKIIGSKVQNLFPQFLWTQMKSQLSNVFSSKEFNNAVKSRYYKDFYGHAFEGLTCIKIVPRNNMIQCVFFILKKQSENLILINFQGIIQNIGSLYIEHFGSLYKQVPFSSLFYSSQKYEYLNFLEQQQHTTGHFIDSSSVKEGWQKYLESIIQYVKKEQLKSILNMTSSKKIMGQKAITYQKYYDYMKQQRKQLFNIKRKVCSQSSINANGQLKIAKLNIFIIHALLKYSKCKLGNLTFYKVLLQKIQKKRQSNFSISNIQKRSIKAQQYQDCFSRDDPFNTQQKIFNFKNTRHNGESDHISDQISLSSSNNLKTNNIIGEDYIVEKNSIHSSLNTQDLVHFNNKFIEICIKSFQNPDEINDKRLIFFTFHSFVLSILFTSLLIGSFIMLQSNLQQVKNIFFADGAVSDNMQLTQFLYNRAMNFKLHKDNVTYIDLIKKSTEYQRQYLYDLMVYDQQSYIQIITSMTKTKFYEYITVPVIWKNSSKINDSIQIESNQFLLFYKLLSMEVELSTQMRSESQSNQIEYYLILMKTNFPELKRINHYNLFLYKQLSDNSLDLIERLFIYLSVGHVFLSILVFCIFYRQKHYRRVQQVQGYSIYKIIPAKVIQILSDYYDRYAQQNKTQADLLKYQNDFQVYGLALTTDSKAFLKPNKSVFITNNNKSPLAIWKIFIVLILLNVLFVIFIISIRQLVEPIKAMMNNVNNLMDSQNYLLEAYFDLKANFIIQQDMNLSNIYFDNLLASQLQSEVIFNKISVQSLDLFTNYDSSFTSQFINLLINDVCDLAQSQISSQEYDKCKTFFQFKYLQNGVIMGMNYFTRKVRLTIDQIQLQVKDMIEAGQQVKDIRKKIVDKFKYDQQFKQIDESIFYMFKLYQGTQAKIYDSLQKTIISTMNMSLFLIIIEVICIGVLFPISLYLNYKQEKIELSKLYVSFLLIPSPVSQFIKIFSQKIQKILEYN